MLAADILERALEARDARFDGIFFVGITSTGVYCRPVCPARVSYSSHRRFFDSAAAAECAGFRPCLRCRPELAPGRALCDAVSRLARIAASQIAGGALNGRSVSQLAGELGVSERHLRRALEREIGVAPVELAQTYRLLLAKQLLGDTSLSVTRIAYASGFQSLRRFNSVFRERYGLNPSAIRTARGSTSARSAASANGAAAIPASDLVQLTLAYRAPLAWDVLISHLRREALPGVEFVERGRYGRTVCVDGLSGVILAEDAGRSGNDPGRAQKLHLKVALSPSLVPALMPLLSRLRHLFDLDAEPTAVDAHLTAGGLGELVRRRPGLRIPGAIDGFDVALRVLLRGPVWAAERSTPSDVVQRVVDSLGAPIETGFPELSRLAPSAEQVAEVGGDRLAALGVPRRRAEAVVALARLIADGRLRLEPGSDPAVCRAALVDATGAGDAIVSMILMRTLGWPDAFPVSDRALQRTVRASSARELQARAERWRPWRAYAALHLWLDAQDAKKRALSR